ncbi:MAG: SRPBCC family protein [Chloroflexota bacterium]
MWIHVHTGETTVSPEAVWKVLRNIDQGASWDTSMDWVRLQGPFRAGSEVVMKPKGQDPITSVIVEVVESERYDDETHLGEVTLRFSHTLKALDNGGTRVIHRLEITGLAADQVGPELGPAITEDFPEAMEALFARAVRDP